MKLKTLLVCVAAIVSLGATMQAQEVTFTGSTVGTFSATMNSTNAGITYTPANPFSNTTVGLQTGFTFGTFSITGPVPNTAGQTFTLEVTFTAPPGTNPSMSNFVASLSGTVAAGPTGNVFFNFLNDFTNPQTFTFDTGRSFQFWVNDVNVQAGRGAVDLTGGAIVKAPDGGSTIALLGIALVAAAAVRRKLAV